MNVLDLVIVGLGAAAMAGGWRLGFVARATSWLGLGIGLGVATRLLPTIVEALQGPNPSSRFIIAFFVLVAGALLGQGLGLLLGSQLRRAVPIGPLRVADRGAGAFVGALGVLVSVWLLLPALADVPGWPAQQARNSTIVRNVDRLAPDPPDTMQALRRLVGNADFPRVFDAVRPAPEAGPPPETLAVPPDVQQRVAASTVKVEGIACRRIQEGSGWAVGTDLIATNAHVVAGEDETEVIRPDGKRMEAIVVAFDPGRDIAVLRVPNLGQAPLMVGDAEEGAEGAVFGHPGGQDALRIAPARIEQRVEAVGRDIYDRAQTRRDVFILASSLRPGDSGGALIDKSGRAVGIAFAIAPDEPGVSYALTSAEIRQVLAKIASRAVDTGPCLT